MIPIEKKDGKPNAGNTHNDPKQPSKDTSRIFNMHSDSHETIKKETIIEGMINVHITGEQGAMDILKEELSTGKLDANGVTEFKDTIKAKLERAGMGESRVKINGVFIVILKSKDVLKTKAEMEKIFARIVEAGYVKFENHSDPEHPDPHKMIYEISRTNKEYVKQEKETETPTIKITIKGIPSSKGITHIGFIHNELLRGFKLKGYVMSPDSEHDEIHLGVKSDNDLETHRDITEALKAVCYSVGKMWNISFTINSKRAEHPSEYLTEMYIELVEKLEDPEKK